MAMQSTRTARQRLSGQAQPASSGRAQQVTIPGTDTEITTLQAAVAGGVGFLILLLLITRGAGGDGSLLIRSAG